MDALLALVPAKDWFIGAAFAVLACMGWHFYDKYQDAVSFQATAKAESAATLAAANEQIATLTSTYNTSLKALKATTDAQLKAAAALHTSDTDRLHALSTARDKDPVLSGAQGTAAAIAAWSQRLSRVELISAGLANAVRADDIAATQCWAERDSVTAR